MAAYTNNPGRTGLNQSRGIIFEEFLPELRGREWYKKADEMRRNCAVIAGALLAMEMPLRDIDFYWESELGETDPRLELLEAAERNMSHTLQDHIIESLSMLWAGYSVFAIWYERVDSRVLWRKFLPLGQDTVFRWDINEEGGIDGLWQYPHVYAERIPIERALLYRTKIERNNPEGWSLLRPAYQAYYYWKNISQIEGISLERGGAGFPTITMPQGADTTEGAGEDSDLGRAERYVRNIRMDEQAGLVLPFGWTFDFKNAGNANYDFDTVIRRYESRMMVAMMTQFLMLGQDRVGTQALSSDQTDFYTQALNSLADIISDAFTRHAIPRLMALNGLDSYGLRLAHSPAGDISLTTMADFLQKVGSFVTWTPQDEAWLRSIARMPEIEQSELETVQHERAQQEMNPNLSMPVIPQAAQDTPSADAQMSIWGHVVDEYVAANAPDDVTRRKLERRLNNQMATFFEQQKARLVKAAKRLR